jgi:3-mercaptopyruvate sulfurtransferase SseA
MKETGPSFLFSVKVRLIVERRQRMEFSKKHRAGVKWHYVVLLLCVLAVPLSINSCSTTTYDTPITPRTSATLISPETLKSWVDSGIVNSTGFDKVVILDVVSSLGTYTTGHIPGAQFFNQNDLYQTRQEGPATDVSMVIEGARMDALIQKYGIDKDTTIVFTGGGSASPSSGAVIQVTRAYWTFRYWGFPKEKLKFLDGLNFSWKALYGLTAGNPPTPAPSTYSVKNNVQLRTDLRAALSEMIDVAEGQVANAIPVDMRSSEADGSYVGKRNSTSGVFNPGNDFMVFEGRLKGGRALLYTTMLDAANNFRFKAADVLAAMFNAIGVDGTKHSHVY